MLAVAASKSGIAFALNLDDGTLAWNTQVGPAGTIGGSMWGSAADSRAVYVSVNNFFHTPLGSFTPNTPTRTGGMIAALDSWDGSVLWSFANPEPQLGAPDKNALSQAPVTVAADVVYYSSMDPQGKLFLLNARTGSVLNSFAMGASNACGPIVANGFLASGSGYNNFGLGNSGAKVTALGLPGKKFCPACAFGCEDSGKCRSS
jgi:polyvinyl alcohol dehydrogenase (cytochrome)